MSTSPSNLLRIALALLLLALAIQPLEIGMEKLFRLPDVPTLEVIQQTQPFGTDKSIAAVKRITGKSVGEVVAIFYWHIALGSFIGLVLGVLVAAGLAWRRRAPWWLSLLILPINAVLIRSGVQDALKPVLLYPVIHLGTSLSLAGKFWAAGALGICGFVLLALVATRVLPPYSRAQAASAPGPRSSE